MLSSTLIYMNKKQEEVARVTFDDSDSRLVHQVRSPGWKSPAERKKKNPRKKNNKDSGDGNDGGMQLPDCRDLRGAAGMVEILEGHTQHFGGQSLRQRSAMLGIQPESVLR